MFSPTCTDLGINIPISPMICSINLYLDQSITIKHVVNSNKLQEKKNEVNGKYRIMFSFIQCNKIKVK